MDSFIYDFFCEEHQTSLWGLASGQSILADIIVPVFVSLVACGITYYFSRKNYEIEEKLANLQIFGIKIDITSQEFNNQIGSKYVINRYYHVKYANKSCVEGYIVSAHLLLGGKYINAQSGRRNELLGGDMKLGSLEGKLLTLDLEWTKTVYKSDLKNNDLFIEFKDSLGNTYSEKFSREKFPELYE